MTSRKPKSCHVILCTTLFSIHPPRFDPRLTLRLARQRSRAVLLVSYFLLPARNRHDASFQVTTGCYGLQVSMIKITVYNFSTCLHSDWWWWTHVCLLCWHTAHCDSPSKSNHCPSAWNDDTAFDQMWLLITKQANSDTLVSESNQSGSYDFRRHADP